MTYKTILVDGDLYALVSPLELYQLNDSRQQLSALEMGGVDNWDWYGDSMCDNYSPTEIDFKTFKENYLLDPINGD